MGNYKVIVAHPGQQHSYRLATALKKEGILFKYITTIYNKKDSLLINLIQKFADKKNAKKASNRRCNYLDDSEVLQFNELSGLISTILARSHKLRKVYWKFNSLLFDKFGEKVAKYAIENNADAVIMYDTTASACFELLKKEAPDIKRIMDVSAANRVYMKEVYEKDMKNCPKFADKLFKEREILWNNNISRYLEEIEYSQFFLVASDFVKKSLEYSGVDSNNIYTSPYGTNFTNKLKNKKLKNKKDKLNILYVGNVTQMKGIYYLLEGLFGFSQNDISVNIVGEYDNSDGLFDKYIDKYNFVGRIPHEEVKYYYENSDIFIMPSLGEGMSLSVLEAMSFGLPVICSTNVGVKSIINEGENGFIISPGDSDEIRNKVQWFIENKDKIPIMSKKAWKTSKKLSWENYEKRTVQHIYKILKKTFNN